MGAIAIDCWSWALICDACAAPLDYVPEGEDLPEEIRAAIEGPGTRITDLNVWQPGPGHQVRSSPSVR